ncbi:MAG: trypsin-like peptidase domain-containing protein [Clostridia bacterium]|nr:trypsin-like peptidase domain-containing protein [Clostridia bacterium]
MKHNSRNAFSRFAMFMAIALVFAAVGGMVGMNLANASAEETTGYDSIYSSSNPVPGIAEKIRPAVVQVIQSTQSWDRSSRQITTQETGFGSGTYIQATDDGGYILTNNHVVEGAQALSIEWLDGTTMDVTLVGSDDGTDVAVLKFTGKAPEGVEPVTMGDSDALQIGELAIVIGTPGSDNLFNTVTVGIISGLDRENMNARNFTRATNTIQTDAAINSGNSGGALLNSKGELVGIPTLKMSGSSSSYSASYEGLGFCVPINTAKPIIEELIANGKVTRPRIGVTVADFDGPDEALDSYPPMGVQIMSVEEDSPAEEAGLQAGDVIYAVDGTRTTSFNAMTAELDKHEAGEKVTLTVYRYYDENGKWLGKYEKLDVEVELKVLD